MRLKIFSACFTECVTNHRHSGHGQGNPYAQQDDFYSPGPYQSQGGGNNQQNPYSQPQSGNGGYGGGYNNNEYEMNNYNTSTSQQLLGGSLSDFFAEVFVLHTPLNKCVVNM